jgi:D-alanine-D-alanine ligase-like ATP-grasp enzyme
MDNYPTFARGIAPLGKRNEYLEQESWGITVAHMEPEFRKLGFATRTSGRFLLFAEKDGKRCIIFETETSFTSRVASRILTRKNIARALFKSGGLNVAEGKAFKPASVDEARAYASNLGLVVIKPTDGQQGKGITTNVSTSTFEAAWRNAVGMTNRKILVESQFSGIEARYLVVDGHCIAVTRRIPPHVVGDGTSSIQQLVAETNEQRKKNPNLRHRPVLIDPSRVETIRSQGYELDGIPPQGAHVVIDIKGGISTGGDSENITAQVHPTMKGVAERVSRLIPGLDVLGVDILAQDHGSPADPTNYIIIEANTRPGIGSHLFPAYGEPINVCRYIAESCDRRLGADASQNLKVPDLSAAPSSEFARKGGRTNCEYNVLFTGDVAFGESYAKNRRSARLRTLLAEEGHMGSLRDVRKLMDKADFIIGNLEVPLSARSADYLADKKKYLGWCDPQLTARALRDSSFGAVSLANNHTLDAGESGLKSSIEILEAFGITPFGAGECSESAERPLIKTVGPAGSERTLVVFGGFERRDLYEQKFNWYAKGDRAGVNPLDVERVSEWISNIKRTVPRPVFVAYPHWGLDYRGVTSYQRRYAAELIQAGIDVIIGHGAHVPQDVDKIGGKWVIFGLGNFAYNSPGMFSKYGACPVGLAAMLSFQEIDEEVAVRLYPVLVDNEVTSFRTRPVGETLFFQTYQSCTRRLNRSPDELRLGYDDFGYFFELGRALGSPAA